MSSNWHQSIQQELQQFSSMGLKRELNEMEQAVKPVLIQNGKRLFNLSSNNYLGLAGHPLIIQAEQEAAERGAGATASRLIIGHDSATNMLEEQIAKWKETESALLFPNGYMANLGVLSTLLHRHDGVFSDRLNHASIVDGIRLSGAAHFRYQHNEMDHLEALLKRAEIKGIKRKLIVTDSVFSMDGDVAPLQDLIFLKTKYDAALMVDEAHAGGVFGSQGQGLAHHLGLHQQVDLHMGTFSKAFGVYGAYVAGRKEWIQYLIHACRSFIYTTALPPVVIGGISKALQLVRMSDDLRQSLLQKSETFRTQLQKKGFDTAPSATQIIPVLIGDEFKALAFSQKLIEKGILSVAIRPPTVPVGTARLRFSLMANHEMKDLEHSISAITDVGKELGVV